MADLTPPPANDHSDDIAIHPKVSGEKRRRLRRWVNRITWGLIILSPLIFIIAAVGYKLGLFDLGVAFGTLNQKLGPLVVMICGIFGLLSLALAFIVKPRKGLIVGIIAILVPLFALGKLKSTEKAVYVKLPFIHDVTTDTQDPPIFGDVIMAERAVIPRVNSADYAGKKAPKFDRKKNKTGEALVSALQTKSFPDIRPLILDSPKDVVFGQALATAKSMGWDIKEQDAATGRIDATDTTFWYGFEDDITIRLREAKGGGTVVDVRSLSRIGGSDIGKNAARVGEFLERLGQTG